MVAALLFIMICTTTVIADNGTAAAAPDPAVQTRVSVKKVVALDNNGKEVSKATADGSRIRVVIDGLPADGKINLQKLVPYLDGHPFKGTYPTGEDATNGILEFTLPGKTMAREPWQPILSSPPWGGVRAVSVSVGPEEGGREWPPTDYSNRPQLTVTLFSGSWWLLVLVIGAVAWGLCYLAANSNILRDGTPRAVDDQKHSPYSLAKTQAAVWFFLVFAAFIFLCLMTGSFNGIMTPNILALIGIGSGTTLGAAMIEAGKSEQEQKRRDELEAQLQAKKSILNTTPDKDVLTKEIQEIAQALASMGEAGDDAEKQKKRAELTAQQLTKQAALATDKEALNKEIHALEQLIRPPSHGLVMDLLSDVNGITLHRFQMLVWTLTLGIVFIIGVYQNLAMPQFDPPLLALMGISSGVYLGFKIPEKQM